MPNRRSVAIAIATASLALAFAASGQAETLYFTNKRKVEALSHEIKGHLIHVTLLNGTKVVMRADSIDWEGTERLKDKGYTLQGTSYDMVASADGNEDAGPIPGSDVPLTSADLRKVGHGLRLRRAAAPTLAVEVPAGGGWTDTHINVKQGMTLTLRASGEANLGSATSGPSGLGRPGGSSGMIADLPHGSLLGRVGLGGHAVNVGAAAQFRPHSAGRLYLAINDASASDNSGGYTVQVSLPSVRKSTGGTMSSATSLGTGGQAPAGAPPGAAAPPRRIPQGQVGAVERSRQRVAGASGR